LFRSIQKRHARPPLPLERGAEPRFIGLHIRNRSLFSKIGLPSIQPASERRTSAEQRVKANIFALA
jgi:hypothetical protein